MLESACITGALSMQANAYRPANSRYSTTDGDLVAQPSIFNDVTESVVLDATALLALLRQGPSTSDTQCAGLAEWKNARLLGQRFVVATVAYRCLVRSRGACRRGIVLMARFPQRFAAATQTIAVHNMHAS